MNNLNNIVHELKTAFDNLDITIESKSLLLKAIKEIDHKSVSYVFLGGSFSYGGGSKGVSDIDMGIVFNNHSYNNKEVLKEQIKKFILDYKEFNNKNGFIPDYVFPGEYMTQSQIDDAIKGRSFLLIDKESLHIPILHNSDFLADYERWFQVWLTLNAFSTYITGDFDKFLKNKLSSWKTIILYLIIENNLTKINVDIIIDTLSEISNTEFKIDSSYTNFKKKESEIVNYLLSNLEKEGYVTKHDENLYIPTVKTIQWKDTIQATILGKLWKSKFLFDFDEMKGFGNIN